MKLLEIIATYCYRHLMDTNGNNGNSVDNSTGVQIRSGGATYQVNEATQQLQTTVSDFVREAQASQEILIALITQMSEQLRATDSKLEENTRQIEQLSSWVVNNRN